jgi:hypothetical protein
MLVVAAIAVGGVAATAVPSVAGRPPSNTVVVDKVVSGDVPAGTTFTVQVTCGSTLPTAAAPTPVTITFDASGNPTTENAVTTGAGTQCTATETDNGGATSTSYACAIERGDTDTDGPPFLGNCGPDDNQATFGDVIGDTATITVTNDFVTPPTTTTPTEPITPAAAAVQATPVFTG